MKIFVKVESKRFIEIFRILLQKSLEDEYFKLEFLKMGNKSETKTINTNISNIFKLSNSLYGK